MGTEPQSHWMLLEDGGNIRKNPLKRQSIDWCVTQCARGVHAEPMLEGLNPKHQHQPSKSTCSLKLLGDEGSDS